jgi:hypothetical protein
MAHQFKVSRPNWSRPLPQPLIILDDGKEFLRLTTLADVVRCGKSSRPGVPALGRGALRMRLLRIRRQLLFHKCV